MKLDFREVMIRPVRYGGVEEENEVRKVVMLFAIPCLVSLQCQMFGRGIVFYLLIFDGYLENNIQYN